MFWYHRSAPASSGSTKGQALLRLLTLQPRLCPDPWASPSLARGQSLDWPTKPLEKETGFGNTLSQWVPWYWG